MSRRTAIPGPRTRPTRVGAPARGQDGSPGNDDTADAGAPGSGIEVSGIDAAAAMAELTDEQREILRLRLHGGLSAAEVAERLSMTVGAVRVAQHRALEALRARLRA